MKYKLVAFWLIVFGALFAFLQTSFEYHFYYIAKPVVLVLKNVCTG